jgi:outer membrane receptor protein involved in Fe transport
MNRSVLIAMACSLSLSAHAMADGVKHMVKIPAGDLAGALELLIKQSGADLVYRPEQVRGLRTRGVSGDLSTEDALARLLEGTTLTLSTDSSGAVLIAAPLPTAPPPASPPASATPDTAAIHADASVQGVGAGNSSVAGSAADEVQEVIVTGSKIRRKDADSVGELVTLNQQDIQQAAVSSVGDLLQKLPSVGVSYNSNGTQGTSYGGSSVSLRYLANTDGDADRTLVLVDGHRWVDGVGARGIRDFVDLNTIPIGMIESVEVLQDGASAIYGADAIAGVVNLHTRSNFEGLTTEAKYGISSHGDGTEYTAIVNWGAKSDTHSFFVSGTYVKDKPVMTGDRELTGTSLSAGLDNLSTAPSSPRGLYVLPGFSTSKTPLTQNIGLTEPTGLSSYHTAALPGDYYNADAQGLDDVEPSERYGLYAKFTQELPAGMRFNADLLYNHRGSSQLYSPTNLYIGGTTGTYKGYAIAANQVYNPFGVGFAANQPWGIQIFTPQVGDRAQFEEVNTYRTSMSLAGDLSLLAHPWTWTLFGSAAENHMQFTEPGGINLEHLALGLSSPQVCAAQPGCVPVDIFGQMTPAQAAYIADTGHETNMTRLYDVTFDVTGGLVNLPAGLLSAAFGVEARELKGSDSPDPYANELSTASGALPLPVSTPTTTQLTRTPTADGSYNVKEAYLELTAPLLADLPLVKKLETDVATRYSDYDTVGSKVTSKVGMAYHPVEGMLLRGTWSQGFRAPSLIELYTGERQANLAGANTDPCNGGAAAHPNLPGCAAVPAAYNQTSYNGGLLPETIAGNPRVHPETAQTWSYGLTLSPVWTPGLVLTFDGYKVTINNAISTPAVATALQLCASQAGSYCSILTRDPTTGQVLNVNSVYENLNEIQTEGYDISLRYNLPTRIGSYDFVLSGTHLSEFDVIAPNPTGGAPTVTRAVGTSTGGTTPSTARSTYPEWKALASLGWTIGDWTTLWRTRYIGSTLDAPAPALPVVPVKNGRVAAIAYHDVQLDHNFASWDMDVTVGVNNLFDQMPPASYANTPINFDIYTYDVMGRYFYVRLSKKIF